MRVRQALGRASGQAAAAHEPVHGHSGEGERLLVAVAAQAYEQRLVVEQADAPGKWVDLDPGLEIDVHSARHAFRGA